MPQAEDNASPEDPPSPEDNSSPEDPATPTAATTATSTGALHPIWGTAPVMWRCTRYVAVHPNRRGALPTDRVQRPNIQEQTRNWHTEPLTAAPLHAHLGPTGGRMGTPPTPPPALRPTPAQSDTSYTLKCEEPVYPAPATQKKGWAPEFPPGPTLRSASIRPASRRQCARGTWPAAR